MMNARKLDSMPRHLWALALMLLCLCLSGYSPTASAQPNAGFDHASTMFPLMGSHEQVRCETCHIKGIFKTTPRDCVGCHVAGNQRGANAMSAKHIQITGACDTCHNVSTFSAVLFNHSAVAPGTCATCHDGTRTIGQSAKHILAPGFTCDACHSTLSFVPVRSFPHSVMNGDTSTCANCHDGVKAKGKPSNHLPRANAAQCGSCHINSAPAFSSFAGGQMDHTGLTSGCAECHGPDVTASSFAGVNRIVVMPPTSPMGSGAHIPSSINCESCHLGSTPVGLMDANASRSAPGTLFATPAPTSAQIHAGMTGGCSSCHETNAVWMGINLYPMAPTTMTAGALYTGFQTRPTAVSSATSVADANHPSGGDCSQCHSGTSSFSGEAKPANHIPTASASLCSACHTTPGDYKTPPTLANIHANAPSTTTNCAQCHGAAAASFAIPLSNFAIVGLPSNHIPSSAGCETCHVGTGSSVAATPVGNGAKFSGSLMSHMGIASNCAACHGSTVTGASFVGVSKIVVMPPTSPMGLSAHIPSSETCETCHLATTPAGMVPASATKTAPGTLFASPAPTGVQIHTGITGGCSSCHDTNAVWMGVSVYPISPSTKTSGAQYRGFQTRPKAGGSSNAVADPTHPGAGDCSQCHSSTSFFSGQDMPANHIPTAPSAQCTVCHTTPGDYTTPPTLANIHANAPSTTGNCAQCHSAAAASFFSIPGSGFSVVGFPSNHLPTSAGCETCHVGAGSSIASLPVGNGARFSGSLMSHTGISNNCAACHGPGITGSSFVGVSKIVVMPATSPMSVNAHIPSSTTCETCHLATTPTGMVAASATLNAPGTLFATPAPTGVQIHSGITGGCSACHDTNAVWMGVNAYPITPTTKIALAQYTGFQTRPKAAGGSFNVADATHPSTGDCSQCHANTNFFSGQDKPANHIPYAASALCSVCHTTPGDYAAMPTLANIHANAPSTTGNCAQCHGAAAPSFAIPAANFSIVGFPTNHLPTSAGCESCHVGTGSSIAATPVGNGAKFSGSLMSHTGISTNCEACHGASITGSSFVGVTKIVVMPPTSPMGASAHIPSSTACESCHLATTPSGMVPASASKTAPGTLFATPAPTSAQIHAGVTAGCSSCHETNAVWMGVNAYPIAPSTKTAGAQYTGFHTRPKTAAGTYNVADASHPSTGDCSQCHSGTNYFTGTDKPANHIPYAAAALCSACHTTPGDFATLPTIANIHANAPSTTSNCAQCHAAAAAAYYAIPGANFAIVGAPSNHMPVSTACETCHVGTGSSMVSLPVGNSAKFSGSLMNHSGITNNCAACHGPGITGSSFVGVSKIVAMPPTSPMGTGSHIPSSTSCETCHLGSTPVGLMAASATKTAPGTAFATPVPTTAQIHTGVTGGCSSCHDTNYVWMGMSVYAIAPTVKTTGAQYTGFQTRPKAAAGTYSVADAAHPSAGDCSQCHSNTNYFSAQDKPANHIPTAAAAQCTACHTTNDYAAMPTLANIHANAPSTTGNCAQCHAAGVVAGFAIPAANFAIVGPPANHMPITTACETCHVGTGSSIAATPVGNGAKFSGSRMSHVGLTSNCESCHGPTITNASFIGVSNIVVMPATSPMGANAHIPSSTSCESCHLGSAPAGLIAASASKTAPGTLFATPVPTTVQIHNGVTAGCSNCHDTNYVWMGMSAYPIAPTTKTTGAQYTGFQTRPKAAASTYSVADGAHPSTGDCSACHSGTNFFTGQDKPANHIPTATTAQCTACHTVAGNYSAMPTLANIHANAPSTTGNCAQCHGASVVAGFAIPANNFSIVGFPSNHLPTTAGCESCHVGTGSSIAALPVGNGAKFSGSLMSHAGITNNCEACHAANITGATFVGVTKIVVMPPTTPMGVNAHIPSTTSCDTCHLATTPAGMVPASATKTAPGTLFATPAPTGVQIHTGITGGCSACHETNMVWMGMGVYPITPSVLSVAGTQYKGFQTRPKTAASTFAVADPAHPSAGGDCSACHTGTTFFAGEIKPANHIPYAATAQCTACHTTTDYSAMPTLANIHANAPSKTTNCAQCHDATVVAGFAIPAANFAIVGPPSNHMPITTACEICHVGAGSSVTTMPVPNGAKFSSSLMSHTGITSNCIACHGAGITGTTFAGVTKIVVMPPTSPVGAAAHIPSSSVCENCHLGTTPTGLVPASATKTAPGTAFLTPAPTSTQIHAGITSGCNSCHDTNMVWMSMNVYPMSPTVMTAGATVQYKGFNSRPTSAGSTYAIKDAAHPATGDCSVCHTGTDYFSGIAKPNGHIPATGACATCHIVAGDYSIAGLTTNANLHSTLAGIPATCISCHTAGTGAGPFAGCTTQATCAAPPALTYQPKMMPLLAGGSPTAPSSSTHIPAAGIACDKCHSPTVFTSFGGMNMKGNTLAHQAVGTMTCISCHEGTPQYSWYGATATSNPKLVTRAVGHEGRKAGQDCIACHTKVYTKFSGAQARVRPVMRGAMNSISQRVLPDGTLGVAALAGDGTPFSHVGVTPAQCQTCHNGQAAKGLPAKHLPTRMSCDSCHRTTAWKPAQFNHDGVVAGQCQSCHNSAAATGKTAGHFMTSRSCDSCHRSVAWVPVSYAHVSPLYRLQPDKIDCVACHLTNGEIIPRQMRGNNRPRPVPVRTGP